MLRKKLWLVATLVILLLAACGGAAEEPAAVESEPETAVSQPADEEMAEESMDEEMADDSMVEHSDDAMAEESMSEESMAEEEMDDAAASADGLPAWQTISLTDAATGETFTLADFAGKTVFVEPMATWCTNCRRQLSDVIVARNTINSDDVVFIGLSVETSLDDATLAQYAANNGYSWTFAVMSPEMVQALAGEFGQSVVNPPSTPHFIISPDGSFTDVETGFESSEELIMQIEAARS